MPGKGEALVKNVAVGINASDVNFSAGAYDPRYLSIANLNYLPLFLEEIPIFFFKHILSEDD